MPQTMTRKLALGAVVELGASHYLASIGLPSLSSTILAATGTAGITGAAIATGGAAIIWMVGYKVAKKYAPRLLSLVSKKSLSLANAMGRTTPVANTRFKELALMLAPNSDNTPTASISRSTASPLDQKPLQEAYESLKKGAATITNVIATEADYRSYMDRLSTAGLTVIDLDGIEQTKKRLAEEPFQSAALAYAEIARAADQPEGMAPDDAETIINRMLTSNEITSKQKHEFLDYISTTLERYAVETENERDRREILRAKAEPTLNALDSNIVARLQQNDDIVAAIEARGQITDVAETVRTINHMIEVHGAAETMRVIVEAPETILKPLRQPTGRESEARTLALDKAAISSLPALTNSLAIYVKNVADNSEDAKQARQVKELRDRQTLADVQLQHREAAYQQIMRRIERETIWLQPAEKTRIMRESLEMLHRSPTGDLKEAKPVIIETAVKSATRSQVEIKAIIEGASREMKAAVLKENSSVIFKDITTHVRATLPEHAFKVMTEKGIKLPLYGEQHVMESLKKQAMETKLKEQMELNQPSSVREKSRYAGIGR